MLEMIVIFLIVVATVSLVMGYSMTGFIYTLLVTSILVTFIGALKGKKSDSESEKNNARI